MNCGLGNLDTLRTYLLQSGFTQPELFDDLLPILGKGVAGAMQRYCNRDFQRSTSAVDEFAADRSYYILRRYPVESITSLELRETYDGAWTAQTLTDVLTQLATYSGLVEFGGQLDLGTTRARITYTGGYHFETLEPADVGYPTALPSGATALPDDLRLAWLVQCNAWFIKRDKLNLVQLAGASPDAAATVAALAGRDLEPEVKTMLKPFVRYA